ncbi:Fungal lipase-like [Trema orientale]|uniref:Fungal lipase-like n=1 Tax=Trema orientale TaxID=63057 RepID=A0A2P5FAU0_TREOI|nr:Fungal lipase-like [Trema orientale]
MASLPTNYTLHLHQCLSSLSPRLCYLRNCEFSRRFPASLSGKIEMFAFRESLRGREKVCSFCCFCKAGTEVDRVSVEEESERPPFDINLAVILAGFAFEAYTSPPDNVGRREVDAANCQTVHLSESFVREIYDGQIFVKLKKGVDLPAMDPWGTSDPYVVMELDGQVVKSKIKWGTKEPKWNEEFTFNIKQPPKKNLQVAAWDANLVTPHKRMGNAGINLDDLCDGDLHEVLVELEGMGGGGKLQLEVKYKSFDEIDEEKDWWRVPLVSEFLRRNGFDTALKRIVGSETVQARQFVNYAFGQLKSFNDAYLTKDRPSNSGNDRNVKSNEKTFLSDMPLQIENSGEGPSNDTGYTAGSNLEELYADNGVGNGYSPELVKQVGEAMESDKDFWKNFANVINQSVVQKLGLPTPEKLKWDGFDLLNRIGLQSKKIAETGYIQSGLATPEGMDEDRDKTSGSPDTSTIHPSIPDIKKATEDLLKQTESVLGTLMVLTAAISESNKEARLSEKGKSKQGDASNVKDDASGSNMNEILAPRDGLVLDEKKAEEMKELFSTAESAMEAWAMLATSLGQPSFIKSEFEKICFLDNASTDTQVAIWRDSVRRRLVVAFRGTEQAKWKDLKTDLMLVPAGLNPERIGGDFKQEVQVHSGFLSAYDSVRIRIFTIIKQAIGYIDDHAEVSFKWHVYVTGHSLGGALATLLALELSSSQLAKRGAVSLTMYNFGSPRVGNKRFADVYNQKVKDSWRVVNHRDIIPTVPRLMGYCHVAQPVYLAKGDIRNVLENLELSGDGYQGDVIGEATPDVLVSEFMKGEKELIEKILQTEINIFRAIRDGSALMQHMEDFYYITLLENVRSNYLTAARSNANVQGPTIERG